VECPPPPLVGGHFALKHPGFGLRAFFFVDLFGNPFPDVFVGSFVRCQSSPVLSVLSGTRRPSLWDGYLPPFLKLLESISAQGFLKALVSRTFPAPPGGISAAHLSEQVLAPSPPSLLSRIGRFFTFLVLLRSILPCRFRRAELPNSIVLCGSTPFHAKLDRVPRFVFPLALFFSF